LSRRQRIALAGIVLGSLVLRAPLARIPLERMPSSLASMMSGRVTRRS